MRLVVAGIDTEIGKTWCSAVLVSAFKADYWKPVQAGDLSNSDTKTVQRMVKNHGGTFHPEAFALRHAISPHKAAEMEGMEIKLENLVAPPSNNPLIIETAGGVMSPLSLQVTNLDLMVHLNDPVVLVVKNYLGSINHTLLSLRAMKSAGIQVVGIIINGDANEASENAYTQLGGVPVLAHISWSPRPDQDWLKMNAAKLASLKNILISHA